MTTHGDEDPKVEAHRLSCRLGPKRCGQCTYLVRVRKWGKRLQLLPPGVDRKMVPKNKRSLACKSWLQPKFGEDGIWRVGCQPCSEAWSGVPRLRGQPMKFARFQVCSPATLQICNLLRHQTLPQHISACRAMLNIDNDCSQQYQVKAPTESEFQTVWHALAQGHPPSRGIAGVSRGNSRKIAKMAGCLAQALRNEDQEFLRNAVSLSMKRDESKNKLVLRYTATRADLKSKSGLLGCLRNPGTGARAITRGTQTAIRAFTGSKQLARHILNITKQLVIDSASDETLSGRQMREGINLDGVKPLTPNLKIVTWDKAHGTRRIISRTFAADEHLNEILQRNVMGNDSIVATIDHSPNLRSQFEVFVRLDEHSIGARVKNLGFAKHRYDSVRKPLGRFVLWIGAMLATADWVRHQRHGREEARRCEAFLARLTEEDYLQLAMMADAVDECVVLTRFLDDEAYDLAAAPDEVASFQRNVHYLFIEGGCTSVLGYTSYALEELRRSMKVINIKKSTKSFGVGDGDVSELVRRCLTRMQAGTSHFFLLHSALFLFLHHCMLAHA